MPVQQQFQDYSFIPESKEKLPDLLDPGAYCAIVKAGSPSYLLSIIKNPNIDRCFKMGMYGGKRGERRFKQAQHSIKPFGRKASVLNGKTFIPVADFKFDFVYMDYSPRVGHYALMKKWWNNLVDGGLMAVHKYYPDNANNVKGVVKFCKENNLDPDRICGGSPWTWWAIKK